ncbi:MAG TPA: putative baseplate assembly protein [Lacipirellulaceae bacterium]|nr:putative baseplate assembly protein [Lacipirellulaceae bacterium]
MVIPLPNLDDRRWAGLVEEARALIPLYSSDWTDHNVHDPGITFLELFASIAEMDIFELNRVPERHKRKFLSLVGIEPAPPAPAQTVLRFDLKNNAGTLDIPSAATLATTDAAGSDVPFTLLEKLTATSGRIAAVFTREGLTTRDHSQNMVHNQPFSLFGNDATLGNTLYLGLTEPLPTTSWTTFYFVLSSARSSQDERRRILSEACQQRSLCASRPNPCAADAMPSLPPIELPLHQSVQLVWECVDTSGNWFTLDVDDHTRSLTLDGHVRVKPSQSVAKGGVAGLPSDFFYLRITLNAGRYDSAPIAACIVLNGAAAEQAVLVANHEIGEGNGETDQAIELNPSPVARGQLTLTSSDGAGSHNWKQRPDFGSSTRTSRDYVLDAQSGKISFGDGDHGLCPAKNEKLYGSYLTTLAEGGNLPDNRVFRLLDPLAGSDKLARIVNSIPAQGGTAAESITSAAGRAIEKLRTPWRAISANDYETLALETPGTDLARVAVAPNTHPAFDCIVAPGIVTVIPVPYLPPEAPQPTPGTLALVQHYLNRRRVIGTRVEVSTPRYLTVTVRATVRALSGTSPSLVEQRVQTALDAFLDPLSGGPDGTGWPFGRNVYRSEIMQVIDATAGVDNVVSLELIAGNCGPVCGNICVPALWLVTPGTHQIGIV